MPGRCWKAEYGDYFFVCSVSDCFLNLVQVLPSRAEREVRAGSVLGAACKMSPLWGSGRPALSTAWLGSVHPH